MQSSVSLIGLSVTPVVVTLVGSAFGWRWGFVICGVPGLVMAAILWRWLRGPRTRQLAEPQDLVSVNAVFRNRNIWLSIVCGFLFGTQTACAYGFLPLYLTGPAYNLSLPAMGALLGASGLAAFAANLAVPFLSDRVGRKPTLLLSSLCMAAMAWLAPIGLPLPLMASLFIALNLGFAGIVLTVAIIPTETVPRTIAATAVALPVVALEIGAASSCRSSPVASPMPSTTRRLRSSSAARQPSSPSSSPRSTGRPRRPRWRWRRPGPACPALNRGPEPREGAPSGS